jgi:hypothetical protein
MICHTCNKEFEDNTGKRKYCSVECYHESHTVKRVCSWCGGKLSCKQKKYCSCECFRAASIGVSKPHIRLSDEQRKERLVERSVKWQKENKVKVYASQIALKHKQLVTILYECPCNHPKKHNHHSDYLRPFDVIKLCPACHSAEHKRLRLLAKQTNNKKVTFNTAINE